MCIVYCYACAPPAVDETCHDAAPQPAPRAAASAAESLPYDKQKPGEQAACVACRHRHHEGMNSWSQGKAIVCTNQEELSISHLNFWSQLLGVWITLFIGSVCGGCTMAWHLNICTGSKCGHTGVFLFIAIMHVQLFFSVFFKREHVRLINWQPTSCKRNPLVQENEICAIKKNPNLYP
jgi:hypothetical protein